MMAGTLPDSPAARVDANTTTSAFSGVGSVVVSGAAFSGVVVAPRFVLTAAHVTGTSPASAIRFVLNFGGDATHVIQAQSVTTYPTARFPNDDLSLIELTVPVPPGVTIYPLARDPIAVGEKITLVGYGGSGNGDSGMSVPNSSTVKRSGQNVLDTLQAGFYSYDFDGPGAGTLGNAIETLVAVGDSGSPAFVGNPGGYRLVGINTFTNGPSGDYRFGIGGSGILLTRPQYVQWIDATTGYTTAGLPNVDAPTLPWWATLLCVCLLARFLSKSRGTPR